MQSIYRFRQADVGLFLKARLEGIGSIKLEPLALSVNFRSRTEIVEWGDRSFASIFPSEEDLEYGAVAFSRSEAGESKQFGGSIGMHPFPDARAEAERVVELIQAAGDERVGVLVRARSDLAAIVGALKRNNIAFQAIEIDQLGERAVIEDLMALTLALLHPGDRVSWLAILRAPWCGLALHDLDAVAGGDHRAAVWDLLHRADLLVSEDGATRVQRILPVLERAIAERGRRPLRDWIEGVWFQLGGPACAEDETALEDAAAYLDLLEDVAEGADLADFAWFREQVNALFGQPDSKAGDRLQLMTIHKAKGLEFDTVILPGLHSIPRQEEPSLLLWLEQGGELLMAPISQTGHDRDPIYKYLSLVERHKIEQETRRLLYVAATRARGRLHLLGVVKAKEDGAIAEPHAASFLKLLWPMVEPAFASVSGIETAEEAAPLRKIRRVPADWIVPAPPLPVVWTRREIEVMETPPLTYEWVGDTLRHAGTALHGFLERIAREGPDAWSPEVVRSRRAVYRAVLGNLGVSPAEVDEAAERVETALLRMLPAVGVDWSAPLFIPKQATLFEL